MSEDFAVILSRQILLGSVATHLRWVGQFFDSFMKCFRTNLQVKIFRKLINIWLDYKDKIVWVFLQRVCKAAVAIVDAVLNSTVTAASRKNCWPGNCCWRSKVYVWAVEGQRQKVPKHDFGHFGHQSSSILMAAFDFLLVPLGLGEIIVKL